MKVTQKQADNSSNHSSAEGAQSSWQNQLAQVVNNSKKAVAQRAFIAGINDSPRMLIQRRQIESYIGIDRQRPVQRLKKPAEDEKSLPATAQRIEKEQTLQRQFNSKSPAPRKQQTTSKFDNTGLPDNLKSGIESLSGLSMDNVKVHYNSSQPTQLNALAYAQGTDIHIAPGQEQHLPHEAWHVVQQVQGRVQPTMQMKNGVPINDDQGLEYEADVMGAKAAQMETYVDNGKLKDAAPSNSQAKVAQGKWFRMSTLLDREDEIEVAEIQALANNGNFFDAFRKILSKYPTLSQDFDAINARFDNEASYAAAFNILWETFEEPNKAYTAAEVIELLEDNEIINKEADVLDETDNDDDDIESLIGQFRDLHISVPFRSDVDQQKEEHNVYWETDDIIVRSNPKPLKDMIAQGNWEGYPISPPLQIQLNGLRKTAKLALYKIAGNAKRNIVGARTKGNMNAFRNTLDAIAKILSNLGGGTHAASLMPLTNLSTSAKYGNDAAPTEGSHVVATPLSIKSGTAGSAPKDGRLMTSIRNLAGLQSKSYVQMHLLNDLVFGPGQLWNLTPGPKQSNVDMEKNVEDPLKRAVLGKGLVINFEAQVNYNNDPIAATNIQIQQNPDKYRFQSIDFTAEQLEYNQATQSWVPASMQDPDVAKVNGSRVTWRYGSLTPLVPKPRILDSATTLHELTSANIQPAAATRIMAFVKNNPAWQPNGANKQAQLAKAVKNWDKGKTIPNISSWKATSVLWT